MKLWMVALAVAGFVLVPVQADDGKEKHGNQELEGVWKIVKIGHHKPAKEFLADARLIFADGLLIDMHGEKVLGVTPFKADATKNPKWLDLINTGETGERVTAQGIYEIAGDDLKIFVGPLGKQRPNEFKVIEGDPPVGVMFLRRVKPAKP